MTGQAYLDFLQNDLPRLLREAAVPQAIIDRMIFQQDGAAVHFRIIVRDYLNAQFPGGWIGRGSPHFPWPPRSPDLNPLDFFAWGYIKERVFNTVNRLDRQQTWQRVQEVCADLKNQPEMVLRATHALSRRLQFCMERQGGHFEQFGHNDPTDFVDNQLYPLPDFIQIQQVGADVEEE